MASSNQPNNTLYVNNLNDKIHKDELRLQLLALFTTYGKVIDVVASKSPKMKGQAFLVFSDLAGATTAMRACEGMSFYDKPLDDPNFVPPNAVNAKDEGDNDEARQTKREKAESDDEMEIDDDDEESAVAPEIPGAIPPDATPRLYCTNLPLEVTDSVLSVLFQQYQGYQATNVTMSPTPNAAGAQVKVAQVTFESAGLANVAKQALDGYTLKKDWVMSVAFV
ncbi:hypothetical protein BDP27DRAFT_1415047 [Rhodocollybia butyracea]|uniref:RRM domain-containing protein n=1 Tax=Rhodocollybia butyracea TaxID=206335 RepID=A0A9P5UE60_9AGAR|nr:hypothetical protein BDP27DRAFT_1415047 [Rhodocollybia butyracea]